MKRLWLSLILIFAILRPISAHASSPYDGPPSDIKSFEKILLESIATISCTYKKGIGFFGTYSLSQESRDKGYNSLIVTNQSLINDCIRGQGGSINIGFNGKNYNSVYSGFNVDGSDLATVISSLSPPQINLYDNYWPKLGGWVYAAYYVEGFGIIFRSSKIQLINETTFVIAIDGITPAPVYGGLVFNSSGNFVGTIAMMGPGSAPAGMLKVHGAPLQCEIPGADRGTITRCTEGTRPKIWTIDAPSSVVAKPSPTPTAVSISKELSAGQLLGFQAIQRFESARKSCEAELKKLDENILESAANFEFLNLCNSLDSEFEDLRMDIVDFDLRAQNVPQGVLTLGRLTTSVDGLVRELNSAKADVAASRSTLVSFTRVISEIQGWLDFTAETWPEIENRVSVLPKATQAMIKKNSVFKKAMVLADDLESKSEQLEEIIEAASAATNLDDLKSALNDGLRLKGSMKSYQEFSNNVKVIEKLIPAFVCTKGQLVANLPKTGKCAPGYSKVSTK